MVLNWGLFKELSSVGRGVRGWSEAGHHSSLPQQCPSSLPCPSRATGGGGLLLPLAFRAPQKLPGAPGVPVTQRFPCGALTSNLRPPPGPSVPCRTQASLASRNQAGTRPPSRPSQLRSPPGHLALHTLERGLHGHQPAWADRLTLQARASGNRWTKGAGWVGQDRPRGPGDLRVGDNADQRRIRDSWGSGGPGREEKQRFRQSQAQGGQNSSRSPAATELLVTLRSHPCSLSLNTSC